MFQNPLPGGRLLNATSAGSDKAVWAVGDYGTIMFWNGSALTQQRSNTTSNLYDVEALDANNAWAVGEAGTILRTTNGGATWSRVAPSPTPYDLLSVTAAASNRVWAAGGYDGFNNAVIVFFNGSTWSRQLELATGGFTDIFALNSNQVWAVSVWTWYTSNGGTTWRMVNDGSLDAPYRVSAAAANNVYAIDWNGNILRSTSNPGGASWTRVLTGQDWPADLCALDASHIYFAGWEGTIRMFNGSSWTPHNSKTTADVCGIDAFNASRVFAAGDGLFMTNTGGKPWTSRTGGSTAALNNTAAASADEVWAVGAKGTILHSGDGGAYWETQASGTTKSLEGVSALDPGRVWAVGASGTILFYNGTSWSGQTSGTTRALYSVCALDPRHAWAVGASGTILFYNGTSWTGQPSGTTRALGCVFGFDSSHVWAVGDRGTILFYNGTSWTAQASGTTTNLLGVWSVDGSHAWAVGAKGEVLFFDGSRWSRQATPVTRDLQSVSATDSSHVWAVGNSGTILFFDGSSWSDQASSLTSNTLYGVFAYDNNDIWATGAGGTILFADPPYIKTCSPYYCDPGETLDVQVIGAYTHFQGAPPALSFGEGVQVVPGSLDVVDNTHVLARIHVDPGARLGPREVSVITALEAPIPLAGGLVVGSDPTVAKVEPASAPRGWTGTVRVAGSQTHFDASSTLTMGSGIKVNRVAAADAEHLTAEISVTGSAAATARAVNVLTGSEKPRPLAGGFTVPAPPVVGSVSPSSGPAGSVVTVSGRGFGVPSSPGGRPANRVTFNGNAASCVSWSNSRVKCVVPPGEGAQRVEVTNTNGTSNGVEAFALTSPLWYLPEGSTAWGFRTDIAIANPNAEAVTARVTFLTNDGPVQGPDIRMAPSSRTTINPGDSGVLPGMDFSTRVRCLEGRTIAVDRTMSWEAGGQGGEGHSSIGVAAPSERWYLPEGSSAWGFECWLLIMNPSSDDAECAVTYMIEGAGPLTVHKKVKARTRATFNVADDIGAADASIMVESPVPVIPERAMYRNGRSEGHDSVGVTTPANDFFLAEGSTAWGFETYVLVQNPNERAAEVTLTYQTPSGEVPQPAFTLPAGSRKTVRVGDAVPDVDLSTRVRGSLPIVAERSMYWKAGGREACHDSIGVAAPGRAFHFGDGRSGSMGGNVYETWTLVQNPGDAPVRVRVTYLTIDGRDNREFTETIAARSRRSFSMSDLVTDRCAGIAVRAEGDGQEIIAERSMYWGGRAAGTCTVGGRRR